MRFFLRFSFPALLAACLFFYGCATPVPTQGASQTGPAATHMANPLPPAPAPRAGNPVWLFYQDFYDVALEPLEGLHAALSRAAAQGAPDAPKAAKALEGELLLCGLEEKLTEGMVSFGLLMRAEEGGQSYASAVEGAAPGSGSIAPVGGQYLLSFAYTEGATLTGSLTSYRLRYVRQMPELPPDYSLLLLRAPQGWAAVLDFGGGPACVLRCGAQELGLYAMGDQGAAGAASTLLTYDNCTQGAAQAWLYSGGILSIS